MQALPKGMFANIEKQYAALDIGCPAVAAANNKLFDVPSPFSLDLTVGLDESGDSYWRYEFDTKVHVNSLGLRDDEISLENPKVVSESVPVFET